MDLANNIALYMERAYKVWLAKDEELAYMAAFTAYKTLSKKDQIVVLEEVFMKHLNEFKKNQKEGNNQEYSIIIKKTEDIISAFKMKKYGFFDSIMARNSLAKIDPDLEKALGKGDADIFIKRYPDLF